MPTPTSLEARPDDDPTLADALRAISQGTFVRTDLVPLSDLSRAEAAQLADVWPRMPEAVRERAVRWMEELAEERFDLMFGRALRVALDDGSPVVRQLAVRALWEDDGPDLLPALVDLFRCDPSQDVRSEAARGLMSWVERDAAGSLGADPPPPLRAMLVAAAGDPTEPYIVRRRALETAAVYGSDEPVETLIRDAFDSDDAGLRAGALYAMGKTLDKRWLSTIVSELDSPDAEMRYEAARACGEIGDETAVPGLAEMAIDSDAEVRFAAITALGRIGGPLAIRVLRGLREDAPDADHEALSDAIEEALASVDGG